MTAVAIATGTLREKQTASQIQLSFRPSTNAWRSVSQNTPSPLLPLDRRFNTFTNCLFLIASMIPPTSPSSQNFILSHYGSNTAGLDKFLIERYAICISASGMARQIANVLHFSGVLVRKELHTPHTGQAH
ncbi:hypothetical protein KC343_g6632 [Hortaea werneckii]|nr:hypothetical protein KC352_g12862 [Hortaea werneckii]KAI7569488.1 hypothetical protein KC317_g3291 [Hortaea werneckii]KAI7625509.1 hypothetical protein KC343_g6632 [Hortaea werneckii]KAI7666032.1 hypothetical protein KC319_g7051 [Hortaea werneckii]KAI7708963.1 hypothetical protein KC322_g4870 [Hortaea werneckii]